MRSTSEIAREIAHEFVNSFGVNECDGGRHSIWCLKHTERITAALDAERREGDDLRAIILDAYNGISVLRNICEHLIERMTEAMPELPGLSSLRTKETDRG